MEETVAYTALKKQLDTVYVWMVFFKDFKRLSVVCVIFKLFYFGSTFFFCSLTKVDAEESIEENFPKQVIWVYAKWWDWDNASFCIVDI